MSFILELSPLESPNSTTDNDSGLIHLVLDVSDPGGPATGPTTATPQGVAAWQAPQQWWAYPPQQAPYAAQQQGFKASGSGVSPTSIGGASQVPAETAHAQRLPSPRPHGLQPQGSPKTTMSPLLQHAAASRKVPGSKLSTRLPTPHPRGTGATRAASLPAPPPHQHPTRSPQKAASGAAARLTAAAARGWAPLSKRATAPAVVGRPLWTSSVSGANAPGRPSPMPRAALQPRENPVDNAFKSVHAADISTNGVAAKPGASAAGAAAAPAPRRGSGTGAASTAAGPQPIVHYLNYNYRPVLLQSPQADMVALSEGIARRRSSTTSAVELPPPPPPSGQA